MLLLPPPTLIEPAQVGSLTRGWKIAVIFTHLAIAGALLVLAISSRVVGKPTWWLGYEAYPPFFLLLVLPFLGPIAVIITTVRISRFVPLAGIASTVLLAVTGAVDISRTPGVALGELVLAGCTAVATIAALAGRRRSVKIGL